MNIKRICSVILSIILLLSCTLCVNAAEDGYSGFKNMPKLSKSEIVSLTKDKPIADFISIYNTVPSVKDEYTLGKVKDSVLQSGLDRLNAYRTIAGLKTVSLDDEYMNYAQAAAVITAANKKMSHYPVQPADMPDSFYETAYKGTSSSNLAGYMRISPEEGPLAYSMDMWMNDSDKTNIDRLGHRRWILNPVMGKTGFGCANTTGEWIYTSVYAIDKSATAGNYDFISWPPSGYMVNDTQFFTTEHAWSISLNPEKYDTSALADISVKIEGASSSWDFNKDSADGYFNINIDGYGSNRNAIIFRPDNADNFEGVYTVTVEGLKTTTGSNATLSYEIDFFSSDNVDDSATPPTPVVDGMGDVNSDGKISAADARITLRVSAKLESLSAEKEKYADVNGDNRISAADARLILRVSAKLQSF